jgi:hypothetical protein
MFVIPAAFNGRRLVKRESILIWIFNANRKNWMTSFAVDSAAFAAMTTQSDCSLAAKYSL